MSEPIYPSPEPSMAPACPSWCTDAGRCRWEPLTPKGSDEYDVPLGAWICDHPLGDAGELVWVYGREFSNRPGEVTVAALIDDTLILNPEAAKSDELRDAAGQMAKAAQMIAAVAA